MRGIYLSYVTSSSGQKKLVPRLEDHVTAIKYIYIFQCSIANYCKHSGHRFNVPHPQTL